MFVTIVGVRPKNLEDVSARTVGRMKKELSPQLVKKRAAKSVGRKAFRVDEQSVTEVIESLMNSGEPFWVKTTKNNISR